MVISESRKYTLGGLATIAIWSLTVALARSIAEQTGPFFGVAIVYLIAGVMLQVILSVRRGNRRSDLKLPPRYLYGCGALFIVNIMALFLAVGIADSGAQTVEIGLINYLWPSLAILMAIPIIGCRAKPWLLLGLIAAAAGLVLVITHDGAVSWQTFSSNVLANPAAYCLSATAAVSWSLYSNLTRKWTDANTGSAVHIFMFTSGALLFAVAAIKSDIRVPPLRATIEIATLGVATAVAYYWWDNAMRKGDSVFVISAAYLTPLLSTVVSCLYLRVKPGISLWIGCLIIIAGSFISKYSVSLPDTATQQQRSSNDSLPAS